MTSLMHYIGKKLLNLGVHLLENESTVLSDESKVRLTGLRFHWSVTTHLKRREMPEGAIKERIGNRDPEAFQVLLAHNPSYMKEYLPGDARSDPKWASAWRYGENSGNRRCDRTGFCIFPKYSGEMRRVGDQTIIVSKGLGTHTIHIRLFNPAEVVVLSLNNC